MQIQKWFKTRGPTGMLSCFSSFEVQRVQISEKCSSEMWPATLHMVALRRQVDFTISHQWTDACCLHVSIWVKYINEISIKWFIIAWGLQLALGQLIWIRNGQNSGNHHSRKGEVPWKSVLAFIIYVVYMIELLELVSLHHTLWIKYKKFWNLLKEKYATLWICIKTTHQFQNLLLTK